jgi:hypothetical protein
VVLIEYFLTRYHVTSIIVRGMSSRKAIFEAPFTKDPMIQYSSLGNSLGKRRVVRAMRILSNGHND